MACCCSMFGLLLCMSSMGVKYIYPLTKSYEIITKKDQKDCHNQRIQWLSYWMIFTVLLLVENVLFFLNSIPGYSLLKTLACLWLIHPDFLGASFVYEVGMTKVQAILDKTAGKHLEKIFGFLDNQEQQAKVEVTEGKGKSE